MAKILVIPLDRGDLTPREISPRLRTQLIYFVGAPGAAGQPALREDEFWFDPAEVVKWLDDGVFYLISPLDTANMTEVELTEEQEDFLGWLRAQRVQHVRVVG